MPNCSPRRRSSLPRTRPSRSTSRSSTAEAVAAWVAAAPLSRYPGALAAARPARGLAGAPTAYLQIVGVRSGTAMASSPPAARGAPRSPTSQPPASASCARRASEPARTEPPASASTRRSTSCSPTATVRCTRRAGRDGAPTSTRSVHARLDHRTGHRPPIEVDDHPRTSFLSEVADFLNPLAPMHDLPQVFGAHRRRWRPTAEPSPADEPPSHQDARRA